MNNKKKLNYNLERILSMCSVPYMWTLITMIYQTLASPCHKIITIGNYYPSITTFGISLGWVLVELYCDDFILLYYTVNRIFNAYFPLTFLPRYWKGGFSYSRLLAFQGFECQVHWQYVYSIKYSTKSTTFILIFIAWWEVWQL